MAINPDTKMLPSRTNKNNTGPRKAPTAPINFQSPAPSARSSTSGRSRTKPSPAPSSDALAPAQPPSTLRIPTTRTKADTVTHLGILCGRKSTQPARRVTPTVNAQMVSRGVIEEKWILYILSFTAGFDAVLCLRAHHQTRIAAASYQTVIRLECHHGSLRDA